MAELLGIEYLRKKLNKVRKRVLTRYAYYDMKKAVEGYQLVIPNKFKYLATILGWCGTATDSMADRLVFHGFRNDSFDLNEIFSMNNPDIMSDSAILAACIGSCSFIYISPDSNGYPRLQVIDGSNATGALDPITNLLTEGYAVLERDPNSQKPTLEAYFLPGTTIFYCNREVVRIMERPNVPYPLLVPIIYRPDATRPFGHSRISRACMAIQQEAMRTLQRSEVSAEFYSFPQRYVIGLSPETELDSYKATISSYLSFTEADDGTKPSLGQFAQMSMQPFTDQIRMLASLFAGETGLTLDDLGFVADNPSSVEAIKASHERLRLTARKAQRTFGSGFLNAGYLAACLRDDFNYERLALYQEKPVWGPLFEPDISALGMIGDAILKLNQAVPGMIDDNVIYDLTGIENE